MLNVQSAAMKNRNLFIILLLTRWIGSIHAQQILNWDIWSCELFYDRSNSNDNTDNTDVCWYTPPMPCNCNYPVEYRDPLTDNNPSTTLHLSDFSYLDYTIRLVRPNNEFWELSKIEFAWGPNQDAPLNSTSEVSIYDINDNRYHQINWFHTYNSGNGINVLTINPAEWNTIAQYAAWRIRFNLKWTGTGTGTIEPAYIIIEGRNVTTNPTMSPSKSPSKFPSKSPSIHPTKFPSKSPSDRPSVSPSVSPTTNNPTLAPSESPTYTFVNRRTKYTLGVNSYFNHSNNIIPLSERDMTYSNYQLPDTTKPNGQFVPGVERPYQLTAILAWADIDASIELLGCPNTTYNYSSTDPLDPNSIYHCNTGTWLLKSSGRLADWQDTYGRFELWEVDDRDIKWLQWSFEFNWMNKTCYMIDDDVTTEVEEIKECPVLPLTGTQNQAAYFEFTMPKKYGDARSAPLIAVWYDLLAIPYSIKPELGYEYVNLTLYVPTQGKSFGFHDAMEQFMASIVIAALLFVAFIVLLIYGCKKTSEKKGKQDFMIETRNLKTTFLHAPATEIVDKKDLLKRKFNFRRHCPWIIIILIARLLYTFTFTFSGFYLFIKNVNFDHFNTLDQYDTFAVIRDSQITQFSRVIETFYTNETERMERELQSRNVWCHDTYLNKTLQRYHDGSKSQVGYHSDMMNNPLGNLLILADSSLYVLGDGQTACNMKDAIIWVNSKNGGINYIPRLTTEINATYVQIMNGNATKLVADGYDTSFSNFSDIENVLVPYCEVENWCSGWGFVNRDGSNPPYYVMFNELADPVIEDGVSGICYGSLKLDSDLALLSINSSYFEHYAETLKKQHLDEFQSYADDLYDTLQGIWSSIQDMPDQFDTGTNINLIYQKKYNVSSSANYGIYFDLAGIHGNGGNASIGINYVIDMHIGCPGCPGSNFTQLALQLESFYFLNGSNISDYTNFSDFSVNFSNLISINNAFIEFADIPTIELPFDFETSLNLSLIARIAIALDVLLIIYRIYTTFTIVEKLIFGEDVAVSLKYIMIQQSHSKPKCCDGKTKVECFCNFFDFVRHYRDKIRESCIQRRFYSIWFLFEIVIVALLISMLYFLAEQIATVEFIEGLGTFWLMTTGIDAQRSIRNQVISSTALGYNNYSLTLLERSVSSYAKQLNDDAWHQNIAELQRVDKFNVLFCQGWIAYQTVPKNVISNTLNKTWIYFDPNEADNINVAQLQTERIIPYYNYSVSDTNIAINTANIGNLFDNNANNPNTYWSPNISVDAEQDVIFDFYLPKIVLTPNGYSTWWDITQITLDFRFIYDLNNVPKDAQKPIKFDIQTEGNDTGILTTIAYTNGNTYAPQVTGNRRQNADNALKIITIADEINTARVRIIFRNVSRWGTEYFLNDISIIGHSPKTKVECPKVKFRFWQFDASPTNNWNATQYIYNTPTPENPDGSTYYDGDGTYIELCPQITPIHGLMYRGFVRTWLNEQLVIGHMPFILALKNIALSPFYIAIGWIIAYTIANLLALIIKLFLTKFDLYKENPYARVSLVATDAEGYDIKHHEIHDPGIVTVNYPQQNKEESASDENKQIKIEIDIENKRGESEIEMGLKHHIELQMANNNENESKQSINKETVDMYGEQKYDNDDEKLELDVSTNNTTKGIKYSVQDKQKQFDAMLSVAKIQKNVNNIELMNNEENDDESLDESDDMYVEEKPKVKKETDLIQQTNTGVTNQINMPTDIMKTISQSDNTM